MTSTVADAGPAPGVTGPVLPVWLQQLRQEIIDSEPWKLLAREAYDKMQIALKDAGYVFFNELGDEERASLMDQVETMLRADTRIMAPVSKLACEYLSDALAAEAELSMLSSDVPVNKTDILLERAASGAHALLAKWPDQRVQLATLLNHAIPGDLRLHAWRLSLAAQHHRVAYEQHHQDGRLDQLPSQSVTVARKCQAALNKVPSLASKSAVTTAMTAAVSYVASTRPDIVEDDFYFVILPILATFADVCYHTSHVVEAVSAFADMPRPRYDPDAPEGKDSVQLVGDLDQFLSSADPELHEHITAMFAEHALQRGNAAAGGDGASQAAGMLSHGGGAATPSVADPHRSTATLFGTRTLHSSALGTSGLHQFVAKLTCLADLIATPLQRTFVGTLSFQTVLYIWDTCLVIHDWSLLTQFLTLWLVLLRGPILLADDVGELAQILATESSKLHWRQFQSEMEQRYMPSIRAAHNAPLPDAGHTAGYFDLKAPILAQHRPAVDEAYHFAMSPSREDAALSVADQDDIHTAGSSEWRPAGSGARRLSTVTAAPLSGVRRASILATGPARALSSSSLAAAMLPGYKPDFRPVIPSHVAGVMTRQTSFASAARRGSISSSHSAASSHGSSGSPSQSKRRGSMLSFSKDRRGSVSSISGRSAGQHSSAGADAPRSASPVMATHRASLVRASSKTSLRRSPPLKQQSTPPSPLARAGTTASSARSSTGGSVARNIATWRRMAWSLVYWRRFLRGKTTELRAATAAANDRLAAHNIVLDQVAALQTAIGELFCGSAAEMAERDRVLAARIDSYRASDASARTAAFGDASADISTQPASKVKAYKKALAKSRKEAIAVLEKQEKAAAKAAKKEMKKSKKSKKK